MRAMRQTIEQATSAKPILRHRFSTGRLRKRGGRYGLPHDMSVFIKDAFSELLCRSRVANRSCSSDCSAWF
ncbi:hypothetical protein MESS4_680085 [Mesorhizobium sp. STM 4661]|nr:hypothetical protein MESS4_680085 [Mesorhizobium sp. STM 4661]